MAAGRLWCLIGPSGAPTPVRRHGRRWTLTRAEVPTASASTQPTDLATSATAQKGMKAILTSEDPMAVEVNFPIIPSILHLEF